MQGEHVFKQRDPLPGANKLPKQEARKHSTRTSTVGQCSRFERRRKAGRQPTNGLRGTKAFSMLLLLLLLLRFHSSLLPRPLTCVCLGGVLWVADGISKPVVNPRHPSAIGVADPCHLLKQMTKAWPISMPTRQGLATTACGGSQNSKNS